MIRTTRTVLLVCALLAPASPAAAQLEVVTRAFEKINSVTAYGQTTCLTDSENLSTRTWGECGLQGFGAEVLVSLVRKENDFRVELGLGANYLSGFEAEEGLFDLRGSLLEFPTLSVYISRDLSESTGVYAGVNRGLLELQSVRAYDAEGREFAVDGRTYIVGVSAGAYRYLGNLPLAVFIEPSFRLRKLNSIDWDLGEDPLPLPAGWPRNLDFTGFTLSIGAQFDLTGDGGEKAEPAPAPAALRSF